MLELVPVPKLVIVEVVVATNVVDQTVKIGRGDGAVRVPPTVVEVPGGRLAAGANASRSSGGGGGGGGGGGRRAGRVHDGGRAPLCVCAGGKEARVLRGIVGGRRGGRRRGRGRGRIASRPLGQISVSLHGWWWCYFWSGE